MDTEFPQYPDHCARCGTKGHPEDWLRYPHTVSPTSPGRVRADYTCPTCGHTWFVSWAEKGSDL